MFVYVDDQGYNDQGAQSTDLAWATPFISELAQTGVRLTRYYGMHLCTPSRATLMTGKLPIHTGMSHSLITGNAPWGLPLEHELLPEVLKKCNANTRAHAVGKWHLGHFAHAYTPLQRGFDSFLGFYSGFEDYFVHVAEMTECFVEADCFYDLRDDTRPVKSAEFNVKLFNRRAAEIVRDHAPDAPLFLYSAIPLVHAPMEAPHDVLMRHHERLQHIPNHERRVFAAQTVLLDESVEALVNVLRASALYDNSLVVVASDNGGNPTADGAASNWPLRGMKGYYFEGGVRCHGVVHSPLLGEKATGSEFSGLMSVADWMPTLVGGFLDREGALPPDLDGVNLWDAIAKTSAATARTRDELLLNIDLSTDMHADEKVHSSAFISGDLKLLQNVQMMPRWPVPQNNTPHIGGPRGMWDWLSAPYDSYLFNLTEDPTESRDPQERERRTPPRSSA